MKTYNFIPSVVDTDSIAFSKPDGSPFTKEEVASLTKELNSHSPDKMIWADDGYFEKVIVLRAKNYVLWDGKKAKYKGSATKTATKEPALKEFMLKIFDTIIKEEYDYTNIYETYVKEILDVKEIKRWCSKKTISQKTLENDRTNEVNIRKAIVGSEYVEGDKIYLFVKTDGTLCLVERFDGDYDKKKLLKRLYDTAEIFEHIIDVKANFKNYALVKNYKELVK